MIPKPVPKFLDFCRPLAFCITNSYGGIQVWKQDGKFFCQSGEMALLYIAYSAAKDSERIEIMQSIHM